MITSINKFNETLLIPRNIDGRKDKLKKQNIKLLQQEVIDGNLTIDESFLFDFNVEVKTKQINGNVYIELHHIPLWFENIIIDGNFICYRSKLTTLKGCPKKINGDFDCSENELESLEYGPEYVDGDYFCNYNELTTLKGCPKKISGGFWCNNNKLTSLEYGPQDVSICYNCKGNKTKFTKEYVNSLCNVEWIYI